MTARPTCVLILTALAAGCGQPAPTSPGPPKYGLESFTPAKPFLNLPASDTGAVPALLSRTGAFTDVPTLAPIPALIPYDLNVPFWVDGAHKKRWIAVPDGPERVHFSSAGEWAFPAGTVFVKHFERPDGTRVETRLLAVDGPGKVRGASYRWRSDNSDAELVREPTKADGWYYPGPNDCRKCHTPSAGGVLGVNTRQMNRDYAYPSGTVDNQLRTWAHLGLFTDPPAEAAIADLPRLARLDECGRSLEDRARSYIDANCGYCHRPGGAVADFDGRYSTPLDRQALVDAPARINFGLDHAKIVAANDPWRSVLLVRMATLEQSKMPPLGHEAIDQHGIELLTEWIKSLPGSAVVAPPEIAPKGGDFAKPVRVEIRHPDPAAVIRYTLDGRPPTAKSKVYAGPLELKTPATVRVKAFKDGEMPSITVQETYIIGE